MTEQRTTDGTRASAHERRLALLGEVYGLVTRTVEGLDAEGFARPTRTEAWNVKELLFHQLLDAQRALVALATPSPAEPDVDAVSYWAPFRPDQGDGGAAHARFVQRAAAAYDGTDGLVSQWRATAAAAVRAAAALEPGTRVETQGHVLTVADLVSTLVVEATVHHLDLTLEVDGSPPVPDALALTCSVLDVLLGRLLPTEWDDVTAVLKGTGRLALTDADRATLGAAADRLPLLG